MKVALHVNNSAHQKSHVEWMAEGLARHGVETETAEFNVPGPADVAIIWGWKQRAVIDRGGPVLVMERGHLQPRMEFTSLGWNGLGYRATYPAGDESRWRKHWGKMAEWKHYGRYALLIGQCAGDASLWGVNFDQWAQDCTDGLTGLGYSVVYRPHPLMVRGGYLWHPKGSALSTGLLDDDLQKALLCVTYNSTAGVEAVLAGVPTVTVDEGAMAWPVTTHRIDTAPQWPDRWQWAADLAWCQWNEQEIRSGEAWDAVRQVM